MLADPIDHALQSFAEADLRFVPEEPAGFVRGAARWTGTSSGNLNPSLPDNKRPAYATVDLSAGASFNNWDLTLYVNNVANNQKIIQCWIQTDTQEPLIY